MAQGRQCLGAVGMSRIGIVLLVGLLSLQSSGVLSQGGQMMTDPTETQALLAFRKALVDPQNKLMTWVSTTDPCVTQWARVYCDANTTTGNITYLHVTELRMLTMGLSGNLVPDLGNLSYITTLDVMWNYLTGGIPKELGQLSNLKILALNGNRLSGIIPPELGNLTNMNRIQLDENQLGGPVPSTFGNLTAVAHMHMNNNSLNSTIPPELGNLQNLIHILLDNNQLSGQLPPELGNAMRLVIIQLDNNNFQGGVPENYTQLPALTKLSCRNCSLSGAVPDLSNIAHLSFVDLSYNSFNGTIPQIITTNLTTVEFSYNQLEGSIPSSLGQAPRLQTLLLSNNKMNDSIPSFTDYLTKEDKLVLDFQNNSFEYVSLRMVTTAANAPDQVDLRLNNNSDLCTVGQRAIPQIADLCQPVFTTAFQSKGDVNYLPGGGPIAVTYRLKSPSFTYFTSTLQMEFTEYLAAGLDVEPSQISIQSFQWQAGPRLKMIVLIDPPANMKFNESEVNRIQRKLSNWDASNSTLFGPYELLGFALLGKGAKLSKAAIAGIVVGSVAALLIILLLMGLLILTKRGKKLTPAARRRARMLSLRASQQNMLKITGVFAFSYTELAQATEDFNESKEVGRGGYGSVYRGVLESGQVVAIKRANLEAIQRNTEFYNEIELLSRCHHRNLVALVGYCCDEEEQMLVYEFMEGGTLHENLHDGKDSLSFVKRLKIALGSAKGILYLHTEADPPIFHRDIKSNNILLDSRGQAKVADFGLSKLAPDFQDEPGNGGDTQSHISTVVKGTPGYLDPEYFLTRKLTDKSDVYSFGVVLLELITGMQPITYGKNIVREVRGAFDRGEMWKVIDQNMGSYPSEVMDPFIKLAMSCVDNDTNLRPTMKEVTRTLENLLVSTVGKPGLTDMMSMDTTKSDFSGELKKEDISPGPDTGFDTGSSQTSKITSIPESTANFMSGHGKSHVSPR